MSRISVNTEQMEKDAAKLLKDAKKTFLVMIYKHLSYLWTSIYPSATKGFFNRHPDYRDAAKKAEEASNKLRLANKKKEAAEAMAQSAEYYQLAEKLDIVFHSYLSIFLSYS